MRFTAGLSLRNAGLMLAIALVCALLMLGVYAISANGIAQQRAAAEAALWLELLPRSAYDNNLLASPVALLPAEAAALGVAPGSPLYIACRQGAPVALLLPVTSHEGYAGPIELLVGIYVDGRIAGVRVRAHQETPGMGDKIDIQHSPWILSFNGRSLQLPSIDRWRVKADGGAFDQFAGATITPRAVVKSVKIAQEFIAAQQTTLLARFQTAPANPLQQAPP